MAGLAVQTPDGQGTLQLSIGGGYRLEYDVANLQGESHQAAGKLLGAAKEQNISVRTSYLSNKLIINLDGTKEAGKLVGMGEAEALFVDTARLYAESAQRSLSLGRSKVAADQLKLANTFNPAAHYKLENSVMGIAEVNARQQMVSELAKLHGALGENFQQFAIFSREEKIAIITKMREPIETGIKLTTSASIEVAAIDSLKLVKSPAGALRLVGTAGTYIALLEGMVAVAETVQEKFREADLKDAYEAEARLAYEAAHPDRRNDDACREAGMCN